ncbi:MAG: SNF2-related protein, partial [Candidatus Pacearchaeota archaeon]
MGEIIINESFLDEDFPLFEKLENNEFDSSELLDLRVEADSVSEGAKINEIISYELVKKNLAYKLQYQIDGALRILRDLDGSALLADEVGLGKTITAGLVLKECIIRGFVKNVLILTPPSLVDQWVVELREKFELDFKIIEKASDLENVSFAIA